MSKNPTVPVGRLEDMRLSVGRQPGTTLYSVLSNTFGGGAHGMPREWRRLVREAAPPATAATLRTLLTAGHPWAPDSLALAAAVGTGATASVADELDAIDADTLTGELEQRFGDAVPTAWQRVADRPREFLTGYRTLALAVWDAFTPLWDRAADLLDREAERIGVASVTGVLGTVVNDLGDHVGYADGMLRLPHPGPRPTTGAEPTTGPVRRRLVLLPLASGYDACTYSAEHPDLIWIGYPLPGLGRLTHPSADRRAPAAEDRLSLVLGPVRAALLRHARLRPSVSEAAQHAHITVSTATYHCDRLARSGLLRRLRHGREVRLRLSEDGAALLDLLA
ncbi:hypothetical protein ACIRNI_07320 [Streptomyces sp. NPDC093546]|uniref:hypothetical protein n=1 Tax=Streptomyces sp. NPDC093546 TaxID=3366040 RepID=UPI003825D9FF